MPLHNVTHLMQVWIFPPGLILLLMLIGFLIARRGFGAGRKICVLAYILFWVLSSPLFAQMLINGLQKKYPPLDAVKLADNKQSEIVVLGTGVQASPEYASKSTLSEKTLSRVHYTAYLYQYTHAPVLVSGGNRDRLGHTEASLMQSVLQNSYATPVTDTENNSHDTQGQSQLIVPILQKNNIHRIYLVTHAWHMPRSVYAFKNAFANADITIIPAPMGYIDLKSDTFYVNLLPSLNALNTSVLALHEYVGMAWYHIYHFACSQLFTSRYCHPRAGGDPLLVVRCSFQRMDSRLRGNDR